MNRKIVDHEGKPLDEATLARIFRPMSPELCLPVVVPGRRRPTS